MRETLFLRIPVIRRWPALLRRSLSGVRIPHTLRNVSRRYGKKRTTKHFPGVDSRDGTSHAGLFIQDVGSLPTHLRPQRIAVLKCNSPLVPFGEVQQLSKIVRRKL